MEDFHGAVSSGQIRDKAARIVLFIFVMNNICAGLQAVEDLKVGIGGSQFLDAVQTKQDGVREQGAQKGHDSLPIHVHFQQFKVKGFHLYQCHR